MKQLTSLLAAVSFACSAHASPSVIDFEDVIYAAENVRLYELWGIGSEIYTKGYLLRYTPAPQEPYPTGFTAAGPLWRFNYRDTIAVIADSCSARVTLVAQDNNPFDLLSIDLQETNGGSTVPSTVTFEGITSGQQRVTHKVVLNGATTWQTVRFPGWFSRLQEVQWMQGDCYTNMPHMFDNIQLEPSHLRRHPSRGPDAR